MTAKWELALKQISQNKRTKDNFVEQIKKFVTKIINDVPGQMEQSMSLTSQVKQQQVSEAKANEQAQLGTCPLCKQGKIVDKGSFYGCTNYKGEKPCKFTLPKKWSEKAIGKTAIKALITKGTTAKLKGFESKKTGKKFDAKLKLTNGKISFDFN